MAARNISLGGQRIASGRHVRGPRAPLAACTLAAFTLAAFTLAAFTLAAFTLASGRRGFDVGLRVGHR